MFKNVLNGGCKMPTYIYKAVTKQGQVVKNRITESSKVNCIKKLKRNDLNPISVVQTLRLEKREKKKPRNFRKSNTELQKIGTQRVKDSKKSISQRNARKDIISAFH